MTGRQKMQNYLTGIQHVGIPTKNMQATIEFYEKLGFDIAFETVNEQEHARVVFFRLKNLVIEAYEAQDVKMEYGAIDHVAIDVTDVEEIYKEVGLLGLNTLNDEIHFLPFWENGVRFFTIEGPNRERIEFSQYLS